MESARIRLSDLAARLGLEVEGDPAVEIGGVAALDAAGPDDLVFVRSEAFAGQLAASRAGAVIALPGLDVGGRPALRSDDPSRDFYRAARELVPEPAPEPGVHPSAVVAPDAQVDPSASIGAHCCVGRGSRVGARSVLHPGVVLADGVRVGDDCVLHAHVVVSAASQLGDRVVLHAGVVVGGEGFGFVGEAGGGLRRAYNLGRVVIEEEVEIGANSTIDRGTLGDTRIGRGTKIDNLVQIGHNCRIGERVVIVSQAGVAGSSRVESGSVVMAQAGIAGHLSVGPHAFVGPRTGIHKDIPPGGRMLGSPARPERVFQRESAATAYLPGLLRRVRAIERKLGLRGAEASRSRDAEGA